LKNLQRSTTVIQTIIIIINY